jgi:phosphatidyl-myo-inositol dimannoside synthase
MTRRILWVSGQLPPLVGGIQEYNVQVLRRLARHAEIHVACSWRHRAGGADVTLHPLRSVNGAASPAGWREAQAELRSLVDAIAPDHVHFGDAGAAAHAVALPDALRKTATAHGNDLSSPWVECGGQPAGQAVVRGLDRCARVIAVSQHTADLARSAGVSTPIRVITSGCDLERFHPRPVDRAGVLRAFGLPGDVPLLLTVGRLAARKGQSTVMAALARLDRPVAWICVGSGPRRRRLVLRRWLRGPRRRVRFVRHVSGPELAVLYNACDLFVLVPEQRRSRAGLDSEGFGLVYHEAGACGRPVIGADAAGCREAVIDGVTGLLVPPGDPAALALAMARLLADPDLAARMGRAGLAHVRAAGGWERTAALLLTAMTDREDLECGFSTTRSTEPAWAI